MPVFYFLEIAIKYSRHTGLIRGAGVAIGSEFSYGEKLPIWCTFFGTAQEAEGTLSKGLKEYEKRE